MTAELMYDILGLTEKRGDLTMSDSEAKRKWMKENTVFIGVKLQKRTDADILEFLQDHVDAEKKIGMQTIIKDALREYIKNYKGE